MSRDYRNSTSPELMEIAHLLVLEICKKSRPLLPTGEGGNFTLTIDVRGWNPMLVRLGSDGPPIARYCERSN